MALWKSGKQAVRYDASVASERKSAAYDGSAARDSRPEPCDHSAAIWPKNTMAIRPHAPKPYDTNLMKSTMSKKFATFSPGAQPAGDGRTPEMDAGANRAKEGRTHVEEFKMCQ